MADSSHIEELLPLMGEILSNDSQGFDIIHSSVLYQAGKHIGEQAEISGKLSELMDTWILNSPEQ